VGLLRHSLITKDLQQGEIVPCVSTKAKILGNSAFEFHKVLTSVVSLK
jgi:hypothetical protein